MTMLTMLEKPAGATVTATLPTVTYDLENRQITATVIVSRAEPGHYKHEIPFICMPGSGLGVHERTWTVIWTLVSADDLSASFGDHGVKLPPPSSPSVPPPPAALPPDLHSHNPMRVDPPGKPEGSEFRIGFTNHVKAANCFNYDLDLRVNKISSGMVLTRSRSRSDLVIDPTIAVVPEPMT
jgi:hypothetical protein